jgi:hypothetical protein
MAADGTDRRTVAECIPETFCDEPIWGPAASTEAASARASRSRVARHPRRFARKVGRALARKMKQR